MNSGNISVNGQRETANAFLVNGGDVSEGRNLGAGFVPNLDSIEEFRLITNSFDAEYGKFSGAVVNAITKSGTNGFHGDAFEFLRNDKLDAKNYFAPSKSELRRNQFGYAAGGPVMKNNLSGSRTIRVRGRCKVRKRDLCPFRQWRTVRASLTRRCSLLQTVRADRTDNDRWTVLGASDVAAPGLRRNTRRAIQPSGLHLDFAMRISRWRDPASRLGIAGFPYPSLHSFADAFRRYAQLFDNSQRNIANDNKFGERVDFNNKLTGNWSWYYHLDNTNVTSGLAGFASVPGFPTTTPSRAQEFVMSNTKTIGALRSTKSAPASSAMPFTRTIPRAVSRTCLRWVSSRAPAPWASSRWPDIRNTCRRSASAQLGLNIGVPTLDTIQPDTTYTVLTFSPRARVGTHGRSAANSATSRSTNATSPTRTGNSHLTVR